MLKYQCEKCEYSGKKGGVDMEVEELLKKMDVSPDESVLCITAGEAMMRLLETVEEYCPNLHMGRMSKEDLSSLLRSYGSCVIDYHPESHHQERATLLENFEILKKYGLTDDDYDSLDFG